MRSLSKTSDIVDNPELRRGPWTTEEDRLLIHYIACHGEGRWNYLAKCSGLKRTGKSCRLRWLNYLKPDVKRGNLTPQEQILILQLHSKWGNRWSKIAQHLPGRTDNEIKNYWRTRVQKQARHLKIDSNSSAFQDIVRCLWMPRLLQKIQGSLSPMTNNVAPQVETLGHNIYSTSEPFTGIPQDIQLSGCPISPFHTDDYNKTMVNIETNVEKFIDPTMEDWYMLANNWIHDETEDSLWNMDELLQFEERETKNMYFV